VRFSALTTEPNASVAPIHDRMPLFLLPEQVRSWFSGGEAVARILSAVPPELEMRPDPAARPEDRDGNLSMMDLDA